MKSQILNCVHQVVCCNRHGLKAVKTARLFSCVPFQGKWRPKPIQNNTCLSQHRLLLSTTSHKLKDILLPGNVVQSPLPDLELPDNTPLHEIIFDKCDQFKHLPAVSDYTTGKSYTYKQLKEKSICVASALSRKGYKKGDVILMFSPNHADWTVLILATSCLGIWFTAANPGYNADELAGQINHSEAKAIFSFSSLIPVVQDALDKDFPNKVQDVFVFGEYSGYQQFETLLDDDGKALPDVDINTKEDVFVLPYSSGTTGLPKGVMLTHYNVVSNMIQVERVNTIKKDDNVLGLLPLYHAYAQFATQFGTLYVGGHMHNMTQFEPHSFLQCMQDKKINFASLVPPLILFMAKHPMVNDFDLSHLGQILCAAAPLGKELSNDFAQKFPHVNMNQGYGMTEAAPGICIDLEQNSGSVGPLVPDTFARVIDLETGENLGPHKEGELWVKGPQMMKGYFKNAEATKEMLTEDGWMLTGDVCYYDEQGLFYISDRIKELIKYKAFQVAPAELEAILLGHPEVADAAVIGIPDEKAGEVPKAFVVKVPDSNITEEAVIKHVEDQVSNSKRLRGGVEFIQEIPKSPSGKILRRMFRK